MLISEETTFFPSGLFQVNSKLNKLFAGFIFATGAYSIYVLSDEESKEWETDKITSIFFALASQSLPHLVQAYVDHQESSGASYLFTKRCVANLLHYLRVGQIIYEKASGLPSIIPDRLTGLDFSFHLAQISFNTLEIGERGWAWIKRKAD